MHGATIRFFHPELPLAEQEKPASLLSTGRQTPSNLLKSFCLPHFPPFSLAPLGASRRITVSLKNRIPLKAYRLPPYSGWEMRSRLIGFGSGPLSKEWGREYPFITAQEMIRKPVSFGALCITWHRILRCSHRQGVSRGDVRVKHITCARVQQHLA